MTSEHPHTDSLDSLSRRLAGFKKIGWDFDETLIAHPNSKNFWRYIHDNPYRQKHFVITFRTGYLLDSIWNDLNRERSPLRPYHFDGLFGVPESLYHGFMVGAPEGSPYLEWKGEKCRNLGIQILIDDATDHVITGCARYGIEYIHPDAFL